MEIHWVHPEQLEPRQREAADERIRSLAHGHQDLFDVRIAARPNDHHRHGGREVRITCDALGKPLVAARNRADVGLALDEALDAFERQVWRMRHRRIQRRDEQVAEPPELGVVDEIRADEGYGFILTDGGERVYFHRNAVGGGLAFDALAEGECVGLDFEAGREGLQARFVAMAPPHRREA